MPGPTLLPPGRQPSAPCHRGRSAVATDPCRPKGERVDAPAACREYVVAVRAPPAAVERAVDPHRGDAYAGSQANTRSSPSSPATASQRPSVLTDPSFTPSPIGSTCTVAAVRTSRTRITNDVAQAMADPPPKTCSAWMLEDDIVTGAGVAVSNSHRKSSPPSPPKNTVFSSTKQTALSLRGAANSIGADSRLRTARIQMVPFRPRAATNSPLRHRAVHAFGRCADPRNDLKRLTTAAPEQVECAHGRNREHVPGRVEAQPPDLRRRSPDHVGPSRRRPTRDARCGRSHPTRSGYRRQ